jgi:hypothetical protein
MKSKAMKVGLEAEFLVYEDGNIIIPKHVPRDDFPVLGEVRGEPGTSVGETVGNFWKAYYQIVSCIKDGQTIRMVERETLGLKLYREALRMMKTGKEESNARTRNIYGTDIGGLSDQIIENGKIQGVVIGCGLHIHFSCGIEDTVSYAAPKFEPICFNLGLTEKLSPAIVLYNKIGHEEKKTIKVSASALTKPVVFSLVKAMDDAFFSRFITEPDKHTKYRKPGFFELKDYGFEYRSLPANEATMNALPEIVKLAFELMKNLDNWD